MSDSTDLIIPIPNNLQAVMTSDEGLAAILDKLERRAWDEAKDHDPETKAGREGLRSVAYRVSQSKAALDREAKALTEEQRKQIEEINKSRNVAKARLETLRDKIRKPAEEYEQREADRVATHEKNLLAFAKDRASVHSESAVISDLIKEITAHLSDGHDWEEYADAAERMRAAAIEKYTADFDAARQREADEKELEELRKMKAEQEAKAQQEAQAQAAKEAEAARKAAEEEAERARKEAFDKKVEEITGQLADMKKGQIGGEPAEWGAIRFHLQRIETELKQIGEDRDVTALTLTHEAVQDLAIAKHEEEKAERERQIEADRKAAEERAAEAARKAAEEEARRKEEARRAEEEKRFADEAHMAKIRDDIFAELSAILESQGDIEAVIDAIMDGQLPHVYVAA